jgi:hypothetical protein
MARREIDLKIIPGPLVISLNFFAGSVRTYVQLPGIRLKPLVSKVDS